MVSTSLRRFSVERIGDSGAGYLSDAIKVNATLTNLNLRRNQISDSDDYS